jgi:hypothetical protein
VYSTAEIERLLTDGCRHPESWQKARNWPFQTGAKLPTLSRQLGNGGV